MTRTLAEQIEAIKTATHCTHCGADITHEAKFIGPIHDLCGACYSAQLHDKEDTDNE